MTRLVDRLLPEPLWQRAQPLLPPPPPRPREGVPRRVPALILWPARQPRGACRPRNWAAARHHLLAPLDQWAKAGVFDQLQALLLDELGEAGRINLERVSVDSFSLRAVKGGT
jgi:hypothetical protein